MRVTHVITRLIIGGAQENTISSVLGLRSKPGLDVNLVSGPTTGPEGSLEHLFAEHPGALSLLPNLVRPVHPIRDWLAYRQLRSFFLSERPDVVHTHSGKAGVLGRLAAASAGVPIIIHTIHGPSFGTFQSRLANLIFLTAERRASRVTTHFVSVADAMTRQYLAAGIGKPEQYTRILSGFDLVPFLSARNCPELRKRYGIEPDDVVIGKVARMFKLKGHDDLFSIAPDLIRACPKVKFLLVGSGPWETRFRQLARDMGIAGRFVFTGLIPPEQVAEWVGIMDILVHTSRREGLARVLPQALAAGKPVVAFDCDGASEICIHHKTGFLVPPCDSSQLLRGLRDLTESAELRSQFGETGRNFVRDRFSVARMVDELHALYLRLDRQLISPTRV